MRAKPYLREQARLKALRGIGILDTPNEQSFDDINALTAEICDAPICLISFVEDKRQWFKSRIGLDVCETPYDQSICAHAVAQDEYLEIHDTALDERTVDNPLCMGDKPMRFYAGAIMRTRAGLPLGTLCILDYHPRQLSNLQRKTLQTHASYIVKLLELRVAHKNEEVLRREIDHRVKNSLMTVSTFVQLTRKNTLSDDADAALLLIERQVDAVALLHRELHRADETETIYLDRFLGNVIKLLQQSAPYNVKLLGNIDPINIEPVEASALATIISEFVANSIEHAFPDNRSGMIAIRGEQRPDGLIHISCCDNGVGSGHSRKSPILDTVENLGSKILDAAASQLSANIERTCDDDGYAIKFSFRTHYTSRSTSLTECLSAVV